MYYDLSEAQKEHVPAQAQRLPRGSAGAAFGNSENLLDAANYVVQAWNVITTITISNVFKTAAMLHTLQIEEIDEEEDNDEIDDKFSDLIQDRLTFVLLSKR